MVNSSNTKILAFNETFYADLDLCFPIQIGDANIEGDGRTLYSALGPKGCKAMRLATPLQSMLFFQEIFHVLYVNRLFFKGWIDICVDRMSLAILL